LRKIGFKNLLKNYLCNNPDQNHTCRNRIEKDFQKMPFCEIFSLGEYVAKEIFENCSKNPF